MTELRTIREVELELRRREREDPLKLVYQPHSKQVEIHQTRSPITLVLGGNRSGKSWAMVADALLHCLGRGTYAEMREPPVEVYYVMPSLPMFRRAIVPIFNQLAPMHEIKRISERGTLITFKNGSRLHFVSSDMRRERLQGFAAVKVYMDETPKEDIYEELTARLRTTRGTMTLGFTPLDVSVYWVRDKIYIPWMAGEAPHVHVIHMPVADENGNSLVPWFTKEDIEKMEMLWPDPAVRAARMYGEFVVRTGLVFKSYDPEIHLIRPFKVPDGWAHWWLVDPQYHRFAALHFVADPFGNYYVVDEYFSQDDQLANRAERMAAIQGDRAIAVPVYVDSANPQDCAELNWHFKRINAPLAAISLSEANIVKRVEKMVLRTHALLEPNPDRAYPSACGMGDELYGSPRLFLFDNLCSTWKQGERTMNSSRLLWELNRLSWGEDGKPDKESADGADCCDALIYGCTVMQVGAIVAPQDTWRQELSESDVAIWNAIERHDRVGRYFRED